MFSYTEWALTLLKAAGHKYIKRIPYQSGGRLRYRYIYNVTHTHQGKHVLDPDHMQVGTKLMLDATSGKEVHGHITDVRGDLVSFEYDDGPRKGEVVTMGKERLAAELDKVHGISEKLSTARAKQKAVVDKLKERGASEKQIAREQKRLDALGAEPEKVVSKKEKKAEPEKDEPKKDEPEKAEPEKAESKKAEAKPSSKGGDAKDALRFYETKGAAELYEKMTDSPAPAPQDEPDRKQIKAMAIATRIAETDLRWDRSTVVGARVDPERDITEDQKTFDTISDIPAPIMRALKNATEAKAGRYDFTRIIGTDGRLVATNRARLVLVKVGDAREQTVVEDGRYAETTNQHPNFDRIIPTHAPAIFTINKDEARALKRALKGTSTREQGGVLIKHNGNDIDVSILGRRIASFPAHTETFRDVVLDTQHFSDLISVETPVTLRFSNEEWTPVVADSASVKQVISPLRK